MYNASNVEQSTMTTTSDQMICSRQRQTNDDPKRSSRESPRGWALPLLYRLWAGSA